MTAGYLVDVGACFDLPAARRAGAEAAVAELWGAVDDGPDHFDVDRLLDTRRRVAEELAGRSGAAGVTLAAVSRLLEAAGIDDEALALSVDAIYRDVRDRTAEPLPGAAEALAGLSERFRVGLVAVGSVDWRRLAVDVDTVLVPSSVGRHRGDVDVVLRGAERLGVAPRHLAVVAPDGSPLLTAATDAGAEAVSVGAAGVAEIAGK